MSGQDWIDVEPFFDAMLAAPPAAANQAGMWQPIETAPKDGKVIRLAWNPGDWTTGDRFWREDRWVASGHFYSPHLPHPHFGIRELYPKSPTHWMPLPAAPTESQARGGDGE